MDFGMLEPLCAAHQVPDYRQFIRSGQRMFHIEVKVEYEYLADPPLGATPDCRDNRLMLDVSREVRSTFLVEADQFLRDAEGEQSVREMLRLAGVLYTRRNEFMVWIVLRKAESIARDPRNRDAEVLSMRVTISCADPCIHREQLMNREDEGLEMAYDEAEETDPEEAEETDPEEAEETDPEEADEAEETDPEELDEAEDMDPDEADDEEGMAMMGPGLAGLTEVEVKEKSIDCVICCEGIVVGSTGSALPCCHVYHRECIAKWLGKSRTCPLCRFELPSTD